jgi:hydrogenase nickel incorporation protein HypA/HybF
MHEMGITQAIMGTALDIAAENNATRIKEVVVSIGELTEVVQSALEFAFECVKPDTIASEATLVVNIVTPKSRCPQCGNEFEHDKFDMSCPACGNLVTESIRGRELQIDSLELDVDEPAEVSPGAEES